MTKAKTGPHRRVAVGVKLPAWMLDWLRQQPHTMVALIENALIETYKLRPPALVVKEQSDDRRN